jgi:hypothetical protein
MPFLVAGAGVTRNAQIRLRRRSIANVRGRLRRIAGAPGTAMSDTKQSLDSAP